MVARVPFRDPLRIRVSLATVWSAFQNVLCIGIASVMCCFFLATAYVNVTLASGGLTRPRVLASDKALRWAGILKRTAGADMWQDACLDDVLAFLQEA